MPPPHRSRAPASVASRAAAPRLATPASGTFCSHLAMRGAPAKAIQELAGHSDNMHLSPAALEASIGLLERRPTNPRTSKFGDILETGRGSGAARTGR